MGLKARKLVCISLVFPEKSPVGRDYVAGIASEVLSLCDPGFIYIGYTDV